MGKPSLIERMREEINVRPCGCSTQEQELCPQHVQALTPAERAAYRRRTRGARGTGRGAGKVSG